MTESTRSPEPPELPYEDKIRVTAGLVDPHLLRISLWAQTQSDFSLSLTLDVHGSLITGELIGRNAWFDELTQRYRDNLGGVTAVMGELGKREPDDKRPDPFIHLRDVHRVNAGGARPRGLEQTGFMWRGRIDSVDGWNIGYLTRSYDDDADE